MGRPTLPSISKLEDVLDLIMKPDKYIAYLTEFKQVHDEAKVALDHLSTKEQIDKYMSDAQDKVEQLTRKAEQLEKMNAEKSMEMAEAEDELVTSKAKFEEYKHEVMAILDIGNTQLAKKVQQFEEERQKHQLAHDEEHAAIKAAKQEIETARAKVQHELDRIAKIKAAME